jgi:hypothetical protein
LLTICSAKILGVAVLLLPEIGSHRANLLAIVDAGSSPKNFRFPTISQMLLSLSLCQIDRYGWKLTYPSLLDHIAFLFAHELHHYRRFHLGLHKREGENLANKWALERVQQLNFEVDGIKLLPPKKKKKPASFFSSNIFDPYKKFRVLTAGNRLLIKYDPKGNYLNQIVTVVRPLRKNSRRVVVETADGKQWRWPLEWITIVR